MKIAACLSGNGRTAAYCKPYLDRFFRGHQVDWFVHAWPGDDAHVPLYAPKAVSREPLPADARDKERRALTRFGHYCFIRLIPMYWGVSRSIALVPDDGYDLIVRLRPDIVPHQRIGHTLAVMEPETVCFAYHMQTPLHLWEKPVPPPGAIPELAGFNDLLFLGPPEMMRRFVHSYDWTGDFCDHPVASQFTATQILYTFIETYLGRAARAPISLYLIDEANAARSLVRYERQNRAEPRFLSDVDHIRRTAPDLAAVASRRAALSPAEAWFEQCWSDDPADPSPRLGDCALRLLRRAHAAALAAH